MSDIETLIMQLDAVNSNKDDTSFQQNDASRQRLIASARALLGRIETPFEFVMQQMVIQVSKPTHKTLLYIYLYRD